MRIRIESLSKRYGKIDALDGLTLEIGDGKIEGETTATRRTELVLIRRGVEDVPYERRPSSDRSAPVRRRPSAFPR
jgi:hypothetical protein